ncbi:DUF4355 domain-containing protein [Brevibacillus humidisoli]|uniref:DUF4355 domain-containing protein n=1 Tax=Brevibacillus humidisoli TaxID=2895522 RepID=UPI001E57E84C|nr:DUF4355 domain-containing protein [Brevibacillus humidisoli]UFJ41368.1 DUF4355 domain-containing protein [Brevibacillus humidisoli]
MKLKLFVTIMMSIVLFILPMVSFAENDNSQTVQKPSVALTQEEYNVLKDKNQLPTDVNIEIVEIDPMEEAKKIPKGAELVEDPKKTDFGKKLIKQFGEDLKKEVKLQDNKKIVIQVEDLKYWKYNDEYTKRKNATSFTKKINNILLPEACAICNNPTGGGTTTISSNYFAGSVLEAKVYLTFTIDEYSDGWFRYVHHPVESTAKWWRTNTEYTVKNAEFQFYLVANELCSNDRGEYESYSTVFTPSWKDSSNTYTYKFNGNYTDWDALYSEGGPYNRHMITSELFRRGSQVEDHFEVRYSNYN